MTQIVVHQRKPLREGHPKSDATIRARAAVDESIRNAADSLKANPIKLIYSLQFLLPAIQNY